MTETQKEKVAQPEQLVETIREGIWTSRSVKRLAADAALRTLATALSECMTKESGLALIEDAKGAQPEQLVETLRRHFPPEASMQSDAHRAAVQAATALSECMACADCGIPVRWCKAVTSNPAHCWRWDYERFDETATALSECREAITEAVRTSTQIAAGRDSRYYIPAGKFARLAALVDLGS